MVKTRKSWCFITTKLTRTEKNKQNKRKNIDFVFGTKYYIDIKNVNVTNIDYKHYIVLGFVEEMMMMKNYKKKSNQIYIDLTGNG